jgi:hypothetical protein
MPSRQLPSQARLTRSSCTREYCDLVNFDWYHPPQAYRCEMSELEQWADENGLTVTEQASTDAQHYLRARVA